MNRPTVLFVCTGNAGRSQIAQALFRQAFGDRSDVESAGVEPWNDLHPMAVKVLAERGVRMHGHHPKSVESIASRRFDLVVTIGDPALQRLPHTLATATRWLHWDIADPADADGTDRSESVFRATADAIDGKLPSLESVLALGAHHGSHARIGISTGMWGIQPYAPSARLRQGQPFVPATHLPLVKAAGYDAIELCIYQGPTHFDAESSGGAAVRHLKTVADDLGISIWSIHSRDVGSLGSPDAAERQAQMDELRRCLALADELGAKIVVSHGLIIGRFAPDARETEAHITASLDALAPDALAGPASIAFENDATLAPGRSAVDVLRRIEPYSNCAFGFVLDPGHANIAGDLAWIADQAGPRLISLHLNDNNGQDDLHRPPTEGTADWSAVQRLLRDGNYQGCWLYEVQPGTEDPVTVMERMMSHHRGLWPGHE